MPIDATTPTLGTTGADTTPRASGLDAMDGEAFLRLFVAQLTNQNPMEPMDATQMMQQTAQFTMVESLEKISTYQQHVMGYSQMAMATTLVGKSIVGIGADGQQVTGVVGDVRVTADGPLLDLGDVELPLANLIRVVAPTAAATTSTTGGTTAGATSTSTTGSTDGTGTTSSGTTGADAGSTA